MNCATDRQKEGYIRQRKGEFCFVSFPFYINSFSNFASEYILQT